MTFERVNDDNSRWWSWEQAPVDIAAACASSLFNYESSTIRYGRHIRRDERISVWTTGDWCRSHTPIPTVSGRFTVDDQWLANVNEVSQASARILKARPLKTLAKGPATWNTGARGWSMVPSLTIAPNGAVLPFTNSEMDTTSWLNPKEKQSTDPLVQYTLWRPEKLPLICCLSLTFTKISVSIKISIVYVSRRFSNAREIHEIRYRNSIFWLHSIGSLVAEKQTLCNISHRICFDSDQPEVKNLSWQKEKGCTRHKGIPASVKVQAPENVIVGPLRWPRWIAVGPSPRPPASASSPPLATWNAIEEWKVEKDLK